MTFDTGNPLGSTDPRDLSDNSENFDRFANGTDPSYSDRLGNTRKSFSGMESDFQQFLLNSGYEDLGTYAAGIEVTARNQIILDGGEYWRVAAGTAIPYTTTGAGMPEGGAFVSVGDANLRQDLASGSPGKGASLVSMEGGPSVEEAVTQVEQDVTQANADILDRVIRVTSIAEIESYSVGAGYVFSLNAGGQSGVFDVVAGDFSTELAADTFNGVYVGLSDDPTATTKVARRRERKCLTPEMFTATGDGVADDTAKVQAALNFAEDKVKGVRGSTYLCSDELEITNDGIEFDLNGSTLDFQLTSTVAGVYIKADNVEIHNGSILVAGSGGAETGGNGHSLNCVTSGVQGDGTGWSGLHAHHLHVTTNRTDAGAHIGLIGENTNFHIHDITVPDNAVCRNIIVCEWGGTPVGGTGHPHNGRIENIKIGAITTPTYGSSGYAFGVWLSAAFNIHVENVEMESGYGVLMCTRGDNANTYAPAEYKELVGTGITFKNLSINSFYGYALRIIGSNRSATLDNIPMSVVGSGLTAIGGKVGANNNFGIGWEQCKDVQINGVDISGSLAGGVTTGSNVDNSVIRGGEISGSELYGVSIGNGARGSGVEGVYLAGNNTSLGASANTAAIVIQNAYDCFAIGCTFGAYDGTGETQEYSIYSPASSVRPKIYRCHTYSAGTTSYVVGGVSSNTLTATGLDSETAAI